MLQKKRHAKRYVRLPMNYGITAGKCASVLPDRAGVTGNHDGTGDGWTHYPGKVAAIEQRAIHCGRLEELEIDGLTLEAASVSRVVGDPDRHLTQPNIQCMTLAGGALREGRSTARRIGRQQTPAAYAPNISAAL
ncbi:hypothetical protein ACNKHX_23450 [Shigella flexneri]